MTARAFGAWGRYVHRRPWAILALSAVFLGVSVASIFAGGQLKNVFPEDTEAGRAGNLLEAELPETGGATFDLVLEGAVPVSDPAFRAGVESAIRPYRDDPRVASVRTPYDGLPDDARYVSLDGRKALVVVTLRADFDAATLQYPDLRAKLGPTELEVLATGNLAINENFETILQEDLERAEIVSLPISLLLLVLVFGSVVAALLPIGTGVLAIVGGLAGVFLLARVTDVSTYSLNIVTLVGLGVAIDYSLFVVSRFREELATGADQATALATTLATAGRTVTFSGLTVAIGLSGLLFYRGSFLAPMGLAGTIVVALAVVYSLTFLPALLALLGPRVDRLRLPFLRSGSSKGFWHAIATRVMDRPVVVLVPVLALLLVAGLPFLDLRLANGDVTMLPEEAESRRGYDVLLAEFPGQAENRLTVVLHHPDGEPLAAENVGALHDLSRAVARVPGVLAVESIVDVDPNLTREEYQGLYANPSALPPHLQAAVNKSVGAHVAVLSVVTSVHPTSDEARDVLAAIRALPEPARGDTLVTGRTAFDVDTADWILARTPAAVAWVMVVTYLLVLVQVRSIVLPLKAVLMNLLSITASFGALVWVFQQGNLSDLMGFTPAPIDPTLPIILFCIVFGLSMDYEVLLLSRMHEEYARTRDNRRAVAQGLERSGALITGAAAIMVVVFAAFAFARVVIIKAVGFGLALAIALDATLVRALLVPATMRLFGDLNWWAPTWLWRFRK